MSRRSELLQFLDELGEARDLVLAELGDSEQIELVELLQLPVEETQELPILQLIRGAGLDSQWMNLLVQRVQNKGRMSEAAAVALTHVLSAFDARDR